MILEKMTDHQDARLAARQCNKFLPILDAQSQRFFDKHILVCQEGLFCESEVLGCRRGYDYCRNVGHAENFFEAIRSRDVMRTAELGKPRGIRVADCSQASNLGKNANQVLSPITTTDNANFRC